MKKHIIPVWGLALCAALLAGCASASESSAAEAKKAEEHYVVLASEDILDSEHMYLYSFDSTKGKQELYRIYEPGIFDPEGFYDLDAYYRKFMPFSPDGRYFYLNGWEQLDMREARKGAPIWNGENSESSWKDIAASIDVEQFIPLTGGGMVYLANTGDMQSDETLWYYDGSENHLLATLNSGWSAEDWYGAGKISDHIGDEFDEVYLKVDEAEEYVYYVVDNDDNSFGDESLMRSRICPEENGEVVAPQVYNIYNPEHWSQSVVYSVKGDKYFDLYTVVPGEAPAFIAKDATSIEPFLDGSGRVCYCCEDEYGSRTVVSATGETYLGNEWMLGPYFAKGPDRSPSETGLFIFTRMDETGSKTWYQCCGGREQPVLGLIDFDYAYDLILDTPDSALMLVKSGDVYSILRFDFVDGTLSFKDTLCQLGDCPTIAGITKADGTYQLMYYTDIDRGYYGTLHIYNNGNDWLVGQNTAFVTVMPDTGTVYSGQAWPESDTGMGALYKNDQIVCDNVYPERVYILGEDRALYIRIESLYYWDGKEETVICDDLCCQRVLPSVQPGISFYPSDESRSF